MSKITVIGAGNVGATISYTLVAKEIASEIVMIDINTDKAMGEALDIRQGVPFASPCNVYAGSYEDARGSDIVIITSGVARKPGQTRLDLAQTNINILKSIAEQLTKHTENNGSDKKTVYLIVSNPVDVLTYAFCKFTGIEESRVIGSGTVLDSARLRARISEYCGNIDRNKVHAYVIGEHGDSMVIPWSLANVSHNTVEEYQRQRSDLAESPEFVRADVEQYVRKSGAKVIGRKGATFHAVSMSVCHICKCILNGIDTHLTVSTILHGEYGIDNVALSLVSVVGRQGARSKILLPLNDEEVEALKRSADSVKAIIDQVQI